MANMNHMNPVETVEALRVLFRSNQPAMLHGKPGGGKTSLVKEFCRSENIGLITVNLSMFEPVDMRGLPHDDGKQTLWRRPNWLPVESRDGKSGIIFFDEVNTNRAMFPTLYQAFCADSNGVRSCGEHVIPNGWLPVAAGNYRSDKAAAVDMPSAFNNRVAHIDYVPDVQFFAGELAAKINLHPIVAAYIRFRPDMLHIMPGETPAATHIPAIQEGERAFPTPRSWEAVSDILKQNPAANLRSRLVASKVSNVVAADFDSFYTVYESAVSPESIIANPDTAPIPDTAGLAWAVTAALASMAKPENMGAIATYGKRFNGNQAEFGVTLRMDCGRRNPNVKETSAFTQWSIEQAKALS